MEQDKKYGVPWLWKRQDIPEKVFQLYEEVLDFLKTRGALIPPKIRVLQRIQEL